MQRRRGFQSLLVLTGILLNLGAGRLLAQPTIGPKTAVPANLFVDDDNAGPQDGSALRPFRTVHQAITAAKDNDIIAVAGGTYPQYLRVESKTVRLYGGYVGGTRAGYAAGTAGNFSVRDPAKYPSHLKGDYKDSIVTLYEAGASVVDGFLVTGGGPSKQGQPQSVGGGFYVYEGSPTISNNIIEKNQTCPPVKQEDKLGGGIYSIAAKLSVLNNFIRNNVASRGAGIFADGPKLVIRGNTVQNNIGVHDHGGGIFLFSPNAEISYNKIIGNEIARELGYGWGGGMIVVSKGGSYKLSHNVFSGNYAPSVGSAFFVDEGADATMDHDLVYDNACNPAGDGFVAPVYVDGADDKIGSSLIANHITIVDHTCKATGPGYGISVTGKSKLTLKNSVLWNNGGGGVKVDAISSATVSYTLCEKLLKGTGNLSKDPLFVNAANLDYRLSQGSPAIGAGEPVGNGGRTNLGAYDNKALAGKGSKNSGGGKATSPNQKTPTTPQSSNPGKVDGGVSTGSGEKASKTYLLRGSAGELPSQVGDDNTKMSKVESKELGGMAVQVELIDSFGQGQTKVGDWTPFHTLRLDIVSQGAKELPFEFDLFHSETKAYATRVVAPFVLKPGKNEVRIPITNLKNTNGSAAKLNEVRRWFIASETPVTLLVGDIFLEGEGAKEGNNGGSVTETGSGAKTSKTYLMRGTTGELPSQVGDDNTKMSKVTSKELGGVAVQVDLIDSFGQGQTKVEDWTPFQTLRLDIVSQGAKELPFEFDLFHSETKAFATRVVAPFVLKPGKNEVRIPIKDLKNTNGSAPKLTEVRRWFVASETPVMLHVGDIFLESSLPGGVDTPLPGVNLTSGNTGKLRAELQRAQPGTTITLPPGRYSPDIYVEKLRGTKEKPIIIAAADARNPPVFVGGTVAFHFAGCNYITLRGLKISGCTGNGINADDAGNLEDPSLGMVFENIVIEDIGPKGTHNALKLSGLDQFAVRGCTFSGWGGSAIDMVGCHDGVVQNCRFLGKAGFSQDSGVQVKGGSERIIIKRNFFKQAGGRAVNLGGSTDLEYFRPKVRNYEARDVEVAGNHFVGSRAPINYASSIQCTVRHNTIVNPETWVLRILQEQPTDNFLPCQRGVFKANLIVFDRRVQVFVNIGENTKPETFSFTGNAWFCTDGNRKPKLPAQETGGIYQVDPLLQNAEAPGLKVGSQNPQLLKVGAHAFEKQLEPAPIKAGRPASSRDEVLPR